jgi:hypothetical protein
MTKRNDEITELHKQLVEKRVDSGNKWRKISGGNAAEISGGNKR